MSRTEPLQWRPVENWFDTPIDHTVEDNTRLLTFVGFLLNYIYHSAPKGETQKRLHAAQLEIFEEIQKWRWTTCLGHHLSSHQKVTLLWPYCNKSTVTVIDVPRKTTLQTWVADTSCTQDSLLQQITGFNHHKTVRKCFFVRVLRNRLGKSWLTLYVVTSFIDFLKLQGHKGEGNGHLHGVWTMHPEEVCQDEVATKTPPRISQSLNVISTICLMWLCYLIREVKGYIGNRIKVILVWFSWHFF
jgi:hypothetical protein